MVVPILFVANNSRSLPASPSNKSFNEHDFVLVSLFSTSQFLTTLFLFLHFFSFPFSPVCNLHFDSSLSDLGLQFVTSYFNFLLLEHVLEELRMLVDHCDLTLDLGNLIGQEKEVLGLTIVVRILLQKAF